MNPYQSSRPVIHYYVLAALLALVLVPASASEPVSTDDPLESMNRSIFSFNEFVDTYALKPVAKGYDFVTPQPVQNLVSNFFNNLGELRNATNGALQLNGQGLFTSVSRLVINSTIGMLGLIDVATPLGLEQQYNDFGITFAKWGVPSGPYLVLPFLGPSTARAGFGRIPDYFSSPMTYYDPQQDAWIARGIDVVNTRSRLMDAEDLIVGDKYTFLREAYLQRRAFLITGEQPEDDF